jgi:predicted phosphohydrolase
MSLYAIGDLHLSFGSGKPMDVFGPAWENHAQRLRDGFSALGPDDICVICGDLSWAMNLADAREDFRFIDGLNGRKIILKGNHDYWWSTASKAKAFFKREGLTTIDILHNNCFYYEDAAICGSRGWLCAEGEDGGHGRKIYERELLRLEASLKAAGDLPDGLRRLCFMHYPPKYGGCESREVIDLLHKYEVKLCCYGHLHGPVQKQAFNGRYEGIEYRLVSADFVDFKPIKIL